MAGGDFSDEEESTAGRSMMTTTDSQAGLKIEATKSSALSWLSVEQDGDGGAEDDETSNERFAVSSDERELDESLRVLTLTTPKDSTFQGISSTSTG